MYSKSEVLKLNQNVAFHTAFGEFWYKEVEIIENRLYCDNQLRNSPTTMGKTPNTEVRDVVRGQDTILDSSWFGDYLRVRENTVA